MQNRFMESKDYIDCIKLAISLGGDADTLAAIAGPMAYVYYKKIPEALVYQAMKKLPEWMVDVSERFDNVVMSIQYNNKNDTSSFLPNWGIDN